MQKAILNRLGFSLGWAGFSALIGLAFLLVLLLYDYARAPHTQCHADESIAKQEGGVVLYSSLSSADSQTLIEAFRKRFPYIQVELQGGTSQRLLERLSAEVRTGNYRADTVLILGPTLEQLKSVPELPLDACPPEDPKVYPVPRVDPSFRWTGIILTPRVFAFNTKLVALKNLPVELTDLLKPDWRGKIVFNPDDLVWFAGLTQWAGEEKGKFFVGNLAKQNLQLESKVTALAQRIAAGGSAGGLLSDRSAVDQLKRGGAPIDFSFIKPVIANVYGVGILRGARHPNAARLFAKFMTSAEGQKAILEMGKLTPARTDVATGIKDLAQKDIFVLDSKQFVEKRLFLVKEFNETLKTAK